jgi:hypothetical protein
MGIWEQAPEDVVRSITMHLLDDFEGLEQDRIAIVVREEFDHLAATTKAPAFVGILAERLARDRLALDQRRAS